jgi:type II secretory pathway component GspD/PulD (secretin)
VNLQEMLDVGNTKISLQTTGFANPKANPAFFFGIDNTNFHMLLEALKVSTDSKTLATPQVLCLNGQHAKIQIGQQLGFLVTTTTQTSTLQNVNFLDVGVVLDVTPTITDEGLVMMQVKPEVSGGQINPNGLPQEDTTEVETTVMLADGQGMIIGGLIKEEDTEVQTKIPYLGDLWLVGRLFQRRTVLRQRNEVIIALVPYIVPHPDDKPAGMNVGLDRARSRLLGPPLERNDRRHWEADLPDAIRNPKHVFSGELRQRVADPYAPGRPDWTEEEE